jgi:hypothetical protein
MLPDQLWVGKHEFVRFELNVRKYLCWDLFVQPMCYIQVLDWYHIHTYTHTHTHTHTCIHKDFCKSCYQYLKTFLFSKPFGSLYHPKIFTLHYVISICFRMVLNQWIRRFFLFEISPKPQYLIGIIILVQVGWVLWYHYWIPWIHLYTNLTLLHT